MLPVAATFYRQCVSLPGWPVQSRFVLILISVFEEWRRDI